MANGRPWSDLDNARLIRLAGEGMLFDLIAERMRRPVAGVRSQYLRLLKAMPRKARTAARLQRDTNLKLPAQGNNLASAEQLADRAARQAAPRSLTAAVFGDPPRGHSALDQRAMEPAR